MSSPATENENTAVEITPEGKISTAKRPITERQRKALAKARESKKKKKEESFLDTNPSYLIATTMLGLGGLGFYYYKKQGGSLQTLVQDYLPKQNPQEPMITLDQISEIITEKTKRLEPKTITKYIDKPITRFVEKEVIKEVIKQPPPVPVLSMEEKQLKSLFG